MGERARRKVAPNKGISIKAPEYLDFQETLNFIASELSKEITRYCAENNRLYVEVGAAMKGIERKNELFIYYYEIFELVAMDGFYTLAGDRIHIHQNGNKKYWEGLQNEREM